MPIFVWMAAAALSASIPVAWWALSADRHLSRRVTENLADYQPTMRQAVLSTPATERFLLPLARTIGSRLVRFTPIGWIDSKGTALAKAGLTGRVSPEQVLGIKLLLPLAVGALLGYRTLGDFSVRGVIMTITSAIAAFVIPDLAIKAKADRRAEEITILLPDILDQLTISVEAGLGFESALGRIASAEDNPLAVEFGRMLQDIRLGTPRVDALEGLANRSQVDDLRTVVLTLRQAEALGVPLAHSLRTLSADMREKRRFRAEEKANQLPIKMIFPLGLCILPVLFIVILGPAIIQFLELF